MVFRHTIATAMLFAIIGGCAAVKPDRAYMSAQLEPPPEAVAALHASQRLIRVFSEADRISARGAVSQVDRLLKNWDLVPDNSLYWGHPGFPALYRNLYAVGYSHHDLFVFELFSGDERSPMVLFVPKGRGVIIAANPLEPVLGDPWPDGGAAPEQPN